MPGQNVNVTTAINSHEFNNNIKTVSTLMFGFISIFNISTNIAKLQCNHNIKIKRYKYNNATKFCCSDTVRQEQSTSKYSVNDMLLFINS